jgi:type IX secretion system PorP/SprF family membrane protein
MKYLKIFGLLITLMSISSVVAQQDPNFTMYNFNRNIINPAYAGSTEFTEVSLAYRSQWLGVPNAPETQTLTYSRPLKKKMGIGISIINDQVFVLKETDVAVDFSYNVKLSETQTLYFGMKAGGAFTSVDLTRVGAPDTDPLFGTNESLFIPQIGAGLYLKNEKYYISLSTPNFLNGKRYEKDGNVPIAALNDMHAYLGGGYTFTLNENLKLTPAFMARVVTGAPASYDISSTFDIREKIKAGINYRTEESVSIFSLFQAKHNFQFGMGYEMSTSKLFEANRKASVEFILKYRWN